MPHSLPRTSARLFYSAFLACVLTVACYRQASSAVITVDHGPNATQQLSKPYVVMVSLDGFRYDYPKRYHADHLLALAAQGASAPDGMIPAYPSITFPNHYTIVTGLYPEHHGIVANTFYDPARKEIYSYHDAATVADGTWYGGTPLWVLAEQQGMRAASFFWVGSEADIQGVRPSYYLKFDNSFPNEQRVEQVLAWLRLPPERRPHFITLYFSDADSAGHEYGPESPQVADAVHELDGEIGKLMEGIKESKLPVDLIVVADHGMAKIEGPPIHLDDYGLQTSFFEQVQGAMLYPRSEDDAQKAYLTLRDKSDKFLVYRRAQVPADLHFDSNPREGDPVIVPTGPYFISFGAGKNPQKPENPPVGAHGYDPARTPEMKAIFFAAGPDIRPGITLAPFENVNIYPLVARILGLDITILKTGPVDGKIDALQGILQTTQLAQTQVTATFDLSSDFSFRENPNLASPNHVWQYGYSETNSLAPDQFRIDTKSDRTDMKCDPTGSIGFWHPAANNGPGPGYYPYVAYNTTKQPQVGCKGWAVRPGEVAMEASATGQYSLVRFTAPAAGTYKVSAQFEGIHYGLSTTDVHVLHNATPLFDADIDGYGGDPAFHKIEGASPTANYSGQVELQANDTVTFAVGYGKNKTNSGDTTGLFAQVQLLAGAPRHNK